MRDRPPLPSSSFVPSSFRQPSALHPLNSLTLSVPSSSREEKAKMIQTLLFVAGINTLFQILFGTRLPVVIKFVRIMHGTQGAMIVASTLQIVLGFRGFWRNVLADCVEVGLSELIILVVFSQYIPHLVKGEKLIFNRLAVIFSVAIVWIYVHLLTVGGAYYKNVAPTTTNTCRTDHAGIISGAPWISIPYPFQLGALTTFDAGEVYAMTTASFVALVESTGTFIVVSRYASATPLPPSVLSRGVGWQVINFEMPQKCSRICTSNWTYGKSIQV
ncbi:hypothetical protein RIF29_11543 [Crotalaria pallida]|uniref:Uncharacterized protein n=1 Tax=Crotalaria pallida TaxID=3830 RepID=A0AAN9P0X2_CROPI